MATIVDTAPVASGFKISEWIFTTDHKRIGILYLIGSLAAFLVAGLMALGIRIEQFSIGESELIQYFVGDFSKNLTTGTAYNAALYFHGAAMILAFLIPGLTGFAANYLIPLMIGAPDVAFPRINALSLWLFWGGIFVALLSFVVPDKPDIMWTGYAPYSIQTSANTALYVFTIHLIGFSSILAAVNFLTTIVYMRAPGMGWNQMNMFVWCSFAAFVIQLVFVPVLAAAVARNQVHRTRPIERAERDDVLEAVGSGVFQRALHAARFELEHRDRARLAQQVEHGRVVERDRHDVQRAVIGDG